MEIVLTQYYTPGIKVIFDLTTSINSKYASKNGYQYMVDSTSRCPERTPEWEKIAWINVLLGQVPDGTLIIYEDCDSINLGGDMSQILTTNFDLGMVQLRGGMGGSQLSSWYNTGVIAIVNSLDMRNFFSSVFSIGANLTNDEQGVMIELNKRNFMINNKNICSLPISWNSWSNNDNLNTGEIYIKSFHGLGLNEKRIQIIDYIKTNNL